MTDTFKISKTSKTQRNNAKKLLKLQAEAEKRGLPIPQKLLPTKRTLDRARKAKKVHARSNWTNFSTPESQKAFLEALSPENREKFLLEKIEANNQARNRRRNTRPG